VSDYENIKLTASARLIMQLGEQLIEDELVALLELIKNGYDADATNVKIKIDTEAITPYGQGRIEIKDNGNGMVPSIVKNSFLRLSTNFKEQEKSSLYFKRRVLGKKGIGRLSFQRLGKFISVVTVPNVNRYKEANLLTEEDIKVLEEYNKININIDWSEFPVDMDFNDIVATVNYENNRPEIFGTSIIISGIRNLNFWKMDSKKEAKLKSELLNMMDPFQMKINENQELNKRNIFHAELDIDGKSYKTEDIDEKLLDEIYDSKVTFDFKDWVYKITVERPLKYVMQRRNSKLKAMEKAGFEVKHEFQHHPEREDYIIDFSDLLDLRTKFPKLDFTIEKSYITKIINDNNGDKEKPVVNTQVDVSKKGDEKDIVNEYAYPGNFSGVIYARDLTNKEEIDIILDKEILKNSKLNTLSSINDVWAAMQGVYIYRNSFRILPYGRKDWIGFTEKSQKTANNIYKEHTVVGYIKIDGFTSEKLEEQTNRQGFVLDEYGKNFLMLLQDILLNIVVKSDVDFRDGFNTKKENNSELVTENGKIIFEMSRASESNKNEKLHDVKTSLNNIKDRLFTTRIIEPKNISTELEKLETSIVEYEKVADEISKRSKQEIYIKDQALSQIKDIVPLLGLGIIAESLTHEMNRIEQNIEDYARESIKNVNDRNIVERNQRNIITQTNYLKIQLAHMESTYRKNLEKIEEIEVRAFLTDMYKNDTSPMHRKAKAKGVHVTIVGDTFKIKANKGILTTIFDNVFLNALYWVDFSKETKVITFNTLSKGIVECFDSGCGVHPEIENKLFEPFMFLKKDGRGLGLFIVKELTENMNCKVWLADERRNQRRYKFVFDFKERVI
jgi:signal transduction histidine kinase